MTIYSFFFFFKQSLPKCWYLIISSRFLVTHLTAELPHKVLPAGTEHPAVDAAWPVEPESEQLGEGPAHSRFLVLD